MNIQVKLQDIMEGMEVQVEGIRTFLNIKTGKVISVSEEDLKAAEDKEPLENLLNWQQEDLDVAYDVVENFDNYEELPTKFEINEYELMKEFCLAIQNETHQELLLNSIKGKGAFRRFKDNVIRLGMEEQWYSYREERYKQIAIEWCQDHNIGCVE